MRRLGPFRPGRTIVVGGHSRGVGKTALVVDLVRTLRGRPVATVKVSAHRHGGPEGFTIERHDLGSPHTATARCLAAGAGAAYLCRCPDARTPDAAAFVRRLARLGWDVIVESNRLAPHLAADVTAFVVSAHTDDWKPSSWQCLPVADVVVLAPGTAGVPDQGVPARRGPCPPAVLAFDRGWRVQGLAAWLDRRLAPVPLRPPRPTHGGGPAIGRASRPGYPFRFGFGDGDSAAGAAAAASWRAASSRTLRAASGEMPWVVCNPKRAAR